MQNLQNELIELLKEKPEYFANDKLIKNKVTEAADKYNTDLIELLLTHNSIKQQFFVPVAKSFVFKLKEFKQFLNNKSFLKESYTSFKNQIGLQDQKGIITGRIKMWCWFFLIKIVCWKAGKTRKNKSGMKYSTMKRLHPMK